MKPNDRQIRKFIGCVGSDNVKSALEYGSNLTPTNQKKRAKIPPMWENHKN